MILGNTTFTYWIILNLNIQINNYVSYLTCSSASAFARLRTYIG